MEKFKIGDKVKVRRDCSGSKKGQIYTVVELKYNGGGHLVSSPILGINPYYDDRNCCTACTETENWIKVKRLSK